jgi:hypothetical protein
VVVLEAVLVPVAVVGVRIAVGVAGKVEVALPAAAAETGELMGLMDDDVVVVTGTREGTIPVLGVLVPSRRGTPLAEAEPTELESDNTEEIPIEVIVAEVAGIRLTGVVAGVAEDGVLVVIVLLAAATFDVAVALPALMGFSAVVVVVVAATAAVVTRALPIVNGITLDRDDALDFFVDEALEAAPPLLLELLRLSSVEESSLLVPPKVPEVVFLVG